MGTGKITAPRQFDMDNKRDALFHCVSNDSLQRFIDHLDEPTFVSGDRPSAKHRGLSI